MREISRAVLRHRRLVLVAWVVVLVAGIPNLSRATGAFSQEFSVPGREGFETNAGILRLYGINQTIDVIVPVLTLPAGKTVDSPGVRAQLAAADAKIAAAAPGARVASYASTGDRAFVSADGRTTFALVYASSRARASTAARSRRRRSAPRSSASPVAGAAIPRHRDRRAAADAGGGRRHCRRARRGARRRSRRAARARVRVRVVHGDRAAADGGRRDLDDLPADLAAGDRHRRLVHRRSSSSR